MGFLGAISGAVWIIGTLVVPETYAPVLLRRRAERLSKITGKVYESKVDMDQGKFSLKAAFKLSLSRPWILLFKEPIVFLLSLYMAIIYGTLYMLFAAYPIVYQQYRGWNQGVGGLPFLGIMVGMIFAVIYTIPDNKRYISTQDKNGGFAPPEARLPPTMVASIAIPVGLFWFGKSIHQLKMELVSTDEDYSVDQLSVDSLDGQYCSRRSIRIWNGACFPWYHELLD